MSPETRLQCNSREVAAKVLDGEAVLINLATGVYYSAEGSGAAAWELLEAGHTLSGAAELLAQRYQLPSEQARADLEKFCQELLRENLVLPRSDEPDALGPPGWGPPGPYQAPGLNAFHDMGDLLAVDPPGPDLTLLP